MSDAETMTVYGAFTMRIDSSAIEPDCKRIATAFETGKLPREKVLRLLKVLKHGTCLEDGDDCDVFYVKWREGVEAVIDEIVGTDDGGRTTDG